MRADRSGALARGAAWTSALFYALVAFEFFYMVSPFAAYLYGVYGPGLNALQLGASTAWLTGFFMPHIVRETHSPLITWHEAIGVSVMTTGITVFVVGAFQIYRAKLTGRGAVIGGLYRYVRHPQYLALMLASFGMLLVWPRYLVSTGFITVCFAYYALARTEEHLCTRRFPDYAAYASTTGMLLPRAVERQLARVPRPATRIRAIAAGLALYGLSLGGATGLARIVHTHSVASLYTYSTDRAVYLSLGRMSTDSIAAIAALATSDPRVHRALDSAGTDPLINYVMPAELLVSEVPMYLPPGARTGHQRPSSLDQATYKVVFTRAIFGAGGSGTGPDILRRAVSKEPVVEAWVDRVGGAVVRVMGPPDAAFYRGMPVPVF